MPEVSSRVNADKSSLLGNTIPPVVGVSAVMFERQDANVIGKCAIVNCVRKARHEVASYVPLDDSPAFGSVKDYRHCLDCLVKKLDAQCCDAAFVVLRGRS